MQVYVCDVITTMKLGVTNREKIDILINNASTNIPEHFLKSKTRKYGISCKSKYYCCFSMSY